MKIVNSISLMPLMVVFLSLSMIVPVFSQMKGPITEYKEENRRIIGMDNMGDIAAIFIEHADEMGLTDDQILKMEPVQSEMRKKYAQFKVNLKIAETELIETMDVKYFDLKNADSAVIKISEIKIAHRLEMLKAMKEIWAILTDEQFNKIKKMKSIYIYQ